MDPTAQANVMMICPNIKCRKALMVPAKFRGQQVRCHYCNLNFTVPHAKSSSKSQAAAPENSGAEKA